MKKNSPNSSGPAGTLLCQLNFDEGKGMHVKDAAGLLPEGNIHYPLHQGEHMPPRDPEWRENGVKGGCLLLDGSSFIQYPADTFSFPDDAFTITLWIAPRTFECDFHASETNGTNNLTGILSQSDRAENRGLLLGYGQFGALSFQIGTGDQWLILSAPEARLQKYKWNYVAASFDGKNSEMSLYLNGEKATSRKIPASEHPAAQAGAPAGKNPPKNFHPAAAPLWLGKNGEAEAIEGGFPGACSGYIDELKIYRECLPAEKIKAYYESCEIPDIPFEEIWLQNILRDDRTRPQYHAAPYQFWMNEPHAPLFHKGKYHLFFQQNMSGPYWGNICWGHWVSDDAVRWKPLKEALTPEPGSVMPDGVWSGGATKDKNGVPVLFFTAANQNFRESDDLISNQNIGVAYPEDIDDPELRTWHVDEHLAIIQKEGQGRPGEFRDPFILKENGLWNMLICSGSAESQGGSVLLYTSDTLEVKPDGSVEMNWQYKGPLYEMPEPERKYGTSWELPVLMPLKNETGTIKKYFFGILPAPVGIGDNKIYYYLGDFDQARGKFTPDPAFSQRPRLLDYGPNVFAGPSLLRDPESGDVWIFSIMIDRRSPREQNASGWAHNAGLTRKLQLTDDGRDVMIRPIDAVKTLEKETLISAENLSLSEANALLSEIKEDMLHIELSADVKKARRFGIALQKNAEKAHAAFCYDPEDKTVTGLYEESAEARPQKVSGPLPAGDTIFLDIYVDRSLIEAFFNNYKAISLRSYPGDPEALGIEIQAEGELRIKRLRVARMGGIF